MKKWGCSLSLIALVCLPVLSAQAQEYDPVHPPNSFQSKSNPNYWKNRKPDAAYWQQDVHYTIQARIDEETDIISASEKLVYTNNSPDALGVVYFHLYQNAFQPGSYHDELNKVNGMKNVDYGKYGNQKLGTILENFTVNGQSVRTELDNTILKVFLNEPIFPGASATFEMNFKTHFEMGSGRRMKAYKTFGNKHYNGVHWYPRIAVYDRKFGWTTDQHLGKEFYGDFGTFDVDLTFADNFVVDATGELQNRNEVLPKSLRTQLDIRNFAEKEWGEEPSVITPYTKGKNKTWRYHAENVHDFAFTADPSYRIGEAQWNGITCIALAQEQHASRWQNAAEYAAKVIQVYSEDFGQYVYHKMIVADARDGMEYPMLTLDGGQDPDYKGLLAHEIGHNWFFGQVGNNETYRAAMDEGFTQFLTAWAQSRIDGDTITYTPSNSKYQRRFTKPTLVKSRVVYYNYIRDAIKGEDPTLNTHSDGFSSAVGHGGGYRHVYYKTATMLYNLQYVLGDVLFLKAMQNYFSQWKIAHPYLEDFRSSIITYTGVDLNWFFDQWIETSKRIDYGIKRVRTVNRKEGVYAITFERKEDMQMPLDFVVVDRNDSAYNFYIPNTWFTKETEATVLPRWIGWDGFNQEYTVEVTIPAGIDHIHIDPSERLADINRLNNDTYFPITYAFDSHINNQPDLENYELFVRPDLWWNGYDGLKAGVHMNGNYLNYKHKFDLNIWVNTGVVQHLDDGFLNPNEFENISFRFNYSTGTEKFSKKSSVFLGAMEMEGLSSYKMGFEKKSNSEKTNVYLFYKTLFRRTTNDISYLLYPTEWLPNRFNNTLNAGLKHNYHYHRGSGFVEFTMKTSAIASDYDYSQLAMEAINNHRLGKLDLHTRTFLQYGTGSRVPFESSLYMAGGNAESMMDNKYTRSIGFVPYSWLGYGESINHFHYGGGLNLRGYSGYLAPFVDANDSLHITYRGNSGGAINAEIDFNRLIGIKGGKLGKVIKLQTYLFGDIGIMSVPTGNSTLQLADVRMDAGVGSTLTIKKFGSLDGIKPLTIRFDVPLFVNRTPFASPDFVQFRWVLSINRAF